MKLYQYDHCPFCVRADMVAGFRQVPHEKVYLLNDDEQAHFDLIGAKMVPILQFDDGRAMGESLDIVAALDAIETPAPHLDPWAEASPQLAALDSEGRAVNCLLFPRNVRIGLPEFATEGAIAYFTERKEAMIGISFGQAMEETAQHKAAAEAMLAAMPELAPPADGRLRMGDVLVYPHLRNLTMVRDLAMPGWMRGYLETVTALCGTHLYDDRAI
ncbi:glutaredoxin 2 [Poseidonocella sp. HB161398]|uniref:glutaredoxin 2 n=1 Tax=Poseidonocella sp. HB161398 TaxID=2320855 RepID=UPI0011093287|nr:glutaredoxin 2 [Poseidonocella sp. HB161398]